MEDEYLNKLAKKAEQRAKLLVANPNFQSDIKEVRKTFNIPVEGLNGQEATQKWHQDFYKKEEECFRNIFGRRRHEVTKLKKAKRFREMLDLEKELNNTLPINALRIAIKNLIKKYKLPLSWQDSVRKYILFNNITNIWLPEGITIVEEHDEDTGLRKLSLEIQDDTRLEDIKKAWPDIEFHQKLLHSYTKKKFQPIRNFERDQEAYNLKKSGKSYNEIADIFSEKYKKDISYDDVASFIKRHKQKTGIN